VVAVGRGDYAATSDELAAGADALGAGAGEAADAVAGHHRRQGLLSILPSWFVSGGLAALASDALFWACSHEALFGLFALAVLMSAVVGGGRSNVPGEGGEGLTASGGNHLEAPEEGLGTIAQCDRCGLRLTECLIGYDISYSRGLNTRRERFRNVETNLFSRAAKVTRNEDGLFSEKGAKIRFDSGNLDVASNVVREGLSGETVPRRAVLAGLTMLRCEGVGHWGMSLEGPNRATLGDGDGPSAAQRRAAASSWESSGESLSPAVSWC
ncbi:hypothetical protein THAOC_00847, partial [Thalassiosira oceanica]